MAIHRVEGDGRWLEVADTPKDAQALHEKHGKDLQKRGAEDFHEKFVKDLREGFVPVYDPQGGETYMRTDRTEAALGSGYSLRATKGPTMVVPKLPWHKERKPNWGYVPPEVA